MTPWPPHAGQAPSELELKREAFTPFALAKAARMVSSRPVKVAGLDRRDPRIGDWSTRTTPSRALRDPWMSEDFPDPATPVTATRTPVGMSTDTSLRLFVVACLMARWPVGVRTVSRSLGGRSRRRPVTDSEADNPLGGPE